MNVPAVPIALYNDHGVLVLEFDRAESAAVVQSLISTARPRGKAEHGIFRVVVRGDAGEPGTIHEAVEP